MHVSRQHDIKPKTVDGDPLQHPAVFPGDGRRHLEARNVPSSLDADFGDVAMVERVVNFDPIQVAQRQVGTLFLVVRVQDRD